MSSGGTPQTMTGACLAGTVTRAVTNTGGGQGHDHNLSANFVGSANSVLQPYLVLIYIIKT